MGLRLKEKPKPPKHLRIIAKYEGEDPGGSITDVLESAKRQITAYMWHNSYDFQRLEIRAEIINP